GAGGWARALGLPGVAGRGEPIDLGFVEILDRIEAAVHIAVERGITDRHFRFVARRHHDETELVRNRHENGAARARLQVLLGDIARLAGKNRSERFFQTYDPTFDPYDPVPPPHPLAD